MDLVKMTDDSMKLVITRLQAFRKALKNGTLPDDEIENNGGKQ